MRKNLKKWGKIALNTLLAIISLKSPVAEIIVENTFDEVNELIKGKEEQPRDPKTGRFIKKSKS